MPALIQTHPLTDITAFDVIDGAKGADLLDGTDGDDTISGLAGDDTIYGGKGNDLVQGGQGADLLGAGQGDDTIHGGAGDDTIHSGLGADLLYGDGGADTFVFARLTSSTVDPAGRDTVFFNHGQGDQIDLSAIDADTNTTGDQAFHLVTHFSGAAGELVVHHDHGGYLVEGDVNGDGTADFAIQVHAATALVANDFVL